MSEITGVPKVEPVYKPGDRPANQPDQPKPGIPAKESEFEKILKEAEEKKKMPTGK